VVGATEVNLPQAEKRDPAKLLTLLYSFSLEPGKEYVIYVIHNDESLCITGTINVYLRVIIQRVPPLPDGVEVLLSH
jgi:hypothetical protein